MDQSCKILYEDSCDTLSSSEISSEWNRLDKNIISSQSADQVFCLQITSDHRLVFWHCNKNSQDSEASDHICDDHRMCNCHHDHCDHTGPDDNDHD